MGRVLKSDFISDLGNVQVRRFEEFFGLVQADGADEMGGGLAGEGFQFVV